MDRPDVSDRATLRKSFWAPGALPAARLRRGGGERLASAQKPLPPGSFGLPLLGETLSIAWNNHGFFIKRFKKYGHVFKSHLFGERVVFFVGPEAFTFFLDERYFTRARGSPGHVQELLCYDSLPLIDGETHRTRKRLILHAFRKEALDAYVPIIQRITSKFIEQWARRGDLTWRDEFQKMGSALVLELFTGQVAGPANAHVASAINDFLKGFTAAPIKLPFTTYGRAIRGRDQLLAHIDEALRQHHQRRFEDVLSELMEARSPDGSRLEDDVLRLELMHLFFAAYGGVYVSLTLFTLALSQHPELWQRARDEVRRVSPEGPITPEQLEKLTFLGQFSQELRRFFPINSTTFFAQVKAPFEYGGYHVPAGWRAAACVHVAMHDPDVFPQPERFDPDRFDARCPMHLEENSYIPHGGGAPDGHRCPGEPVITLLLKIVGTLLLRDYTWELPPQDLKLNRDFFPTPCSGLKVKFRRLPG
ncbi:cytochrome P450 [Pyxidicoccus parkwayensis]|uniref:Cytochrome P450 n=1 Tax=Pyxidicoccus parkwayensis TaxID=2813578 RepID=A0ABX7NMP8_9BACT|nr:cytochrome P450 [Pyxidicoccus parkwaysis]QSQ20045.1 cytochrome P450 [Pyxidicoccus parkwaysis]